MNTKYFYRDENGYDTHHLVLEKEGKFGKVIYHEFSGWVLQTRSTEKAYAIGEVYTEVHTGEIRVQVWGFVAKSQVVEFEGDLYAPIWILDKIDYHLGSGKYSNNEQLYYRTVYNLDTKEFTPEIHNTVSEK